MEVYRSIKKYIDLRDEYNLLLEKFNIQENIYNKLRKTMMMVIFYLEKVWQVYLP